LRNLTSAAWIKLKGALFLLLGLLCATLLLMKRPSLADALLLVVAVWSFCRSYYFAFYVMEKYVDPGFRYSGLLDFARYMIVGKAGSKAEPGRESQRPHP
jgi:hypothetical protein